MNIYSLDSVKKALNHLGIGYSKSCKRKISYSQYLRSRVHVFPKLNLWGEAVLEALRQGALHEAFSARKKANKAAPGFYAKAKLDWFKYQPAVHGLCQTWENF